MSDYQQPGLFPDELTVGQRVRIGNTDVIWNKPAIGYTGVIVDVKLAGTAKVPYYHVKLDEAIGGIRTGWFRRAELRQES
ncbi:MAG: hypothetical protein C4542_09725 [Dehalococcoidia bacterium]|nr:MAG: hypothetical protein C4542_09725 [Dehalococcoidia bacterium]